MEFETFNFSFLFLLKRTQIFFSANTEILCYQLLINFRWMQVLVHFETLVMDSKLLSNLNSNQIESLLSLIEYRNKFVVSELKFANSQTSPYDSIIRPLWFDYPDDEKAIMISDEILIGSHFLLAPILEPGVLERDVYLPRGKGMLFPVNILSKKKHN